MGKSIQDAMIEGLNAMAWALVLKNERSITLTADFGTHKIEFAFKLVDPSQLELLKQCMTAKP